MTATFDIGPHCRACKVPVIKARTLAGTPMLVEAEPGRGGNVDLWFPDETRPPMARVVAPELAFGRTDLRARHTHPGRKRGQS